MDTIQIMSMMDMKFSDNNSGFVGGDFLYYLLLGFVGVTFVAGIYLVMSSTTRVATAGQEADMALMRATSMYSKIISSKDGLGTGESGVLSENRLTQYEARDFIDGVYSPSAMYHIEVERLTDGETWTIGEDFSNVTSCTVERNLSVVIESDDVEGYYTTGVSPASVSFDGDIDTIVVDPGHGGTDPGVVNNGVTEAEKALDISERLVDKLEDEGYNVVLTRDDDSFVDLTERAEIANDEDADIFISVHLNAAGPSAEGSEVFYYDTNYSDDLAGEIQDEFVSRLGTEDRGIKQDSFTVLTQTEMPAVLVEPLFLTNPDEFEMVKEESTREDIAEAIVDGVISYDGSGSGSSSSVAAMGSSNSNGNEDVSKEPGIMNICFLTKPHSLMILSESISASYVTGDNFTMGFTPEDSFDLIIPESTDEELCISPIDEDDDICNRFDDAKLYDEMRVIDAIRGEEDITNEHRITDSPKNIEFYTVYDGGERKIRINIDERPMG